MLPDLCPPNNTKTPNECMHPLLKFCPAPTHPQQYRFQHACIQIRLQQLDSAGYRILWNPVSSVDTAGYRIQLDTLRSAAFRVRLRSAWIQVCVQLRSGTCVQLRSAFGCVLRSAAFCVLRSAAFCVHRRSFAHSHWWAYYDYDKRSGVYTYAHYYDYDRRSGVYTYDYY